ncbi:MAG: NrsF family protein [Polymorphobacter sp.]|uniref:NrsF family protein n=1 Tax=Polymorphobacter sp. TaxID=1909290 RepID=UPI003A88DE7D
MAKLQDDFLDQLAAERTPVTPLGRGPALAMLGLGLVAGMAAVALGLGPRDDLMAGAPTMIFLLRSLMLVVLAGVTGLAALETARPGVGWQSRAWQGALAMAALVPATALLMAALDPAAARAAMFQPSAVLCMGVSLCAAMGFGAVMVAHLRRGAPVTPGRAGTLVGLAAGSLGVLVYSLHCPVDSVMYIGTWYGLAVGISTLAGRLLVPGLIRW